MSYFSIDELCSSDIAKKYGIDNVPNEEELHNLLRLIREVLDPARSILNKPITISSGFRCKDLNARVGGAKNSQHLKGEAADLQCYDPAYLFQIIKNNLIFDQVIFETKDIIKAGKIVGKKTWVHVSYSDTNRNQVLKMHNGKVI